MWITISVFFSELWRGHLYQDLLPFAETYLCTGTVCNSEMTIVKIDGFTTTKNRDLFSTYAKFSEKLFVSTKRVEMFMFNGKFYVRTKCMISK